MDKILAPYVIAIEAMQSPNPEEHFKTVAIEKRHASQEIMNKMLDYLNDEPIS